MTLRVTFLGTSGAVPTPQRSTSALLINRDGDRLLFDCGEGTQRQMMQTGTGFALDGCFLTHLHGDHVYGLPGLLDTLSFNDRDRPLQVYTPPGTKGPLTEWLHGIGGVPDFPVTVTEVTPGETALKADEYRVIVFGVDHDATAVGYALVENDRKGRFDRERAEELGVPVGPKFAQLHEGTPVELEDGRIIEPADVVGPPRPGRRVVYTGDTRPTPQTTTVAADADLLIHDATFRDDHADRAARTGHTTAREAGEIAAAAGARCLALVHLSSRYGDTYGPHRQQAGAAFDGRVIVPEDGDTVDVSFPE